MSTQSTAAPVTTSMVVDASAPRAFEVFTLGMAGWWPASHHIIEAELREMVFEPWVGGHIIDRGVDGSECRWATVLVYDPPERVVFSWNITLDWKVETDLERASEVEVRFTAQSSERTLVELVHRHIERHGPGWETMYEAVGSPGGWGGGLSGFAQAL